eukprot:12060262-Alexandrium_andersonii.AAC.1
MSIEPSRSTEPSTTETEPTEPSTSLTSVEQFKIASGVRILNCAGPGTTSNLTPGGPVREVPRHFAR